MSTEGQFLEQKSVRYALRKHADADGLACDCVGFANAAGGAILLGIEDGHDEAPASQSVADDLPDRLRKRIAQITVNVAITARKAVSANGGEFVEIQVYRNDQSIAATSNGRYFIRVSGETRRLLPDDLGRLMAEKNSFVWELQTTRRIPESAYDEGKLADFVRRVRASDRVSEFVRGKPDAELLGHYQFVRSGSLTNLGILWIGRREDRAALLYAPEIQCIKFDERGRKVRKHVWNDFSQNPLELIEAVWREVPDWRESYELPDGLFRKSVPHYDEVVVRELLANALAHRPYTQRGDIFLNLHPDRLEVRNPGLLPIGVTPRNILHTTSKRNSHLAKVFYDLKLMEGEGSGFDRMYEVLLTSGRPIPEVQEGDGVFRRADGAADAGVPRGDDPQRYRTPPAAGIDPQRPGNLPESEHQPDSRADRRGDTPAQASARAEASGQGGGDRPAGDKAIHGLPMDKEALNQGVLVHSSCTRICPRRQKTLFRRRLGLCTRSANQPGCTEQGQG